VAFCLVLLFVLFVKPHTFPIVMIVGATLWLLGYRRLLPWLAQHNAKQMYKAGKNKALLGWHRLQIAGDGLRAEYESGSSESRFDVIERIAETGSHAYVYVSAISAYVIPKTAITYGNLPEFLENLRRRITASGDQTIGALNR
jgi:YcxB-like protein